MNIYQLSQFKQRRNNEGMWRNRGKEKARSKEERERRTHLHENLI